MSIAELAQKIAPDIIYLIGTTVAKKVKHNKIIMVFNDYDYGSGGYNPIKYSIINTGYSEIQTKIIFAHHIYDEYSNNGQEDLMYARYGDDFIDLKLFEKTGKDDWYDFADVFYDDSNELVALSLIYRDIYFDEASGNFIWQRFEDAYMYHEIVEELEIVSCYERRSAAIIACASGFWWSLWEERETETST